MGLRISDFFYRQERYYTAPQQAWNLAPILLLHSSYRVQTQEYFHSCSRDEHDIVELSFECYQNRSLSAFHMRLV
jgi:hypothetical protein